MTRRREGEGGVSEFFYLVSYIEKLQSKKGVLRTRRQFKSFSREKRSRILLVSDLGIYIHHWVFCLFEYSRQALRWILDLM